MNNGRVMALEVTLYSNAGNSLDLSLSVSRHLKVLNIYRPLMLNETHYKMYFLTFQMCCLSINAQILERALFHMDNSYNIPNIRGTGYICKTNLPSNSAFRGFGGPQGMMITESWMSDVALSCGLPAEEVHTATFSLSQSIVHKY